MQIQQLSKHFQFGLGQVAILSDLQNTDLHRHKQILRSSYPSRGGHTMHLSWGVWRPGSPYRSHAMQPAHISVTLQSSFQWG